MTLHFQKVNNLVQTPPTRDPLARVNNSYISLNPEAIACVGTGSEQRVNIEIAELGTLFMVSPGADFKVSLLSKSGFGLIQSRQAARELENGRYYLYEQRGPAAVFMWEKR